MHTPGPLVHWASLVHGAQVLAGIVAVAVRLQIGVEPLQSVLDTHWTHWPIAVPLDAQRGLAPKHGPEAPPSATPPSETPPSTGLAVAPTAAQPWHRFWAQKDL